ncbi:MAG TPA: hypothetical protein VHL11_21830, partial [Phototrophicaceae bacterium]|nr:hypothetical protein [Phototrophicaceae bacterium]
MNSLLTFLTLSVLIVHLGILLYAVLRKQMKQTELWWFVAVIGLSAVAVATYLLPVDAQLAGKFGRGVLLILALIGLPGAFGSLIIEDMVEGELRRRFLMIWWGFTGIWAALLIVAVLIAPTGNIGQPDWLMLTSNNFNLPTLVVLIGLIISAVMLPATGFYLFYRSILPEIANRALYWVIESAVLLTGIVLLGGGNSALAALGMIALVAVMIGAATAFTQHRVFDIRGSVNRSLILVIVMGFTAATLFGAMYAVTGLNLNSQINGLSVLAALA